MWWPAVITVASGMSESSTSSYSLHHRSRGQDVWLVMTIVEVHVLSKKVLASFRRELDWDEELVEWMARLRSRCVQYSSPVSYSYDIFPGFSDVVGKDFDESAFSDCSWVALYRRACCVCGSESACIWW